MKTRLKKWGNSLALRIPKPFAEEIRLEEDTSVEVSVSNGRLIVVAIPEPEITLEALLAAINKRNLHGEVETGSRVGNEGW
ncbi:MAG TPA: AbrB/MazE/SpoVT family DNA-binding domain-containing protein [Thermoanaerobaculia bacterium]|nr:AbrB/MazE/SpoVT family DNA-binding domain-containing protein [Thermoanaerobaculia bacterium]